MELVITCRHKREMAEANEQSVAAVGESNTISAAAGQEQTLQETNRRINAASKRQYGSTGGAGQVNEKEAPGHYRAKAPRRGNGGRGWVRHWSRRGRGCGHTRGHSLVNEKEEPGHYRAKAPRRGNGGRGWVRHWSRRGRGWGHTRGHSLYINISGGTVSINNYYGAENRAAPMEVSATLKSN